MTRHLPNILVFLLVAGLYLGGALEFVEHQFMDLQARVNQRDATGSLVLVEIDEYSLREIGVWPWPRRRYAQVLDRLVAAGAQEIAVDIDLSSRSDPEDDRRLEAALAAAAHRVILPVFRQHSRTDSGSRLLKTRPLPEFRRHVRIASFNVRPEKDRTIRRIAISQSSDERLPTLSHLLAGEPPMAAGAFYIDFGIRIGSIHHLSYVDVLRGDFDPATIAGRKVVIGASAVQLGDMVPVPLWRSIPGATLQALAYESLVQGRAIHRVGDIPVLVVTLLLALVFGPRLQRSPWRPGLVALVLSSAAIVAGAFVIHARVPMFLELTPWLLTLALSYTVGLIRRIDQQSLRLLAQAITMRRKEAFTRLVVENSFDGIIVTDGQGFIGSFNKSAQAIFNYEEFEVIGKPARMLLGDDRGEAGPALMERVFCQTGTWDVIGRRKDGAEVYLDLAVSRAVLDGRDIFITLARDVTARREAEAQAKRARMHLQDAIDSMPASLMLYDAEGRLILCNDKTREFFPEIAELLLPGIPIETLTRARAERAPPVAARRDREKWILERLERFRDPTGQPVEEEHTDGRWTQAFERRTSDGGVVCVRVDLTELKEHEREITALATRYAQVAAGVEATTAGLAISDPNAPDNPILFVNPAFTSLTGYQGSDVLGRPLFGILQGPRMEDTYLRLFEQAAFDGESAEIDLLLRRKDGTQAWIEVIVSPVKDDHGHVVYCVWVLSDVSDRIEAARALVMAKKAAESANEAKSKFLATMSHELRTPLNAILGFSEMIDDEVFGPLGNDKYGSYVTDIRRSAEHLLAVINDILDMAKIDSGRLLLSEEKICMPEAVAACLRFIGPSAAEKRIKVLSRVPSDLPWLRGDERLIKQILLNLLSNAVKFTQENGHIEIGAYLEPEGGLAVSIADNGIGIDEKYIVQALEPFGQIDNTLARRYEGTGLGLPLAKRFTELHGGELRLKSQVGVGTVVIVRFPGERLVKPLRDTTFFPAA